MIISGENAYKYKKENVAYWDGIDATVESHVGKLLEELEDFSTTKINLYGHCYTEEEIQEMDEEERNNAKAYAVMEISKEVTTFLVDLLEKHYGATFPFVDCDF